MKLLEDEENHTMYLEDDLDAFAAGLNRDLESDSDMELSDSDDGLSNRSSFQTSMGNKKKSFSDLFPIIQPHLNKDSAMQIDIVRKKFKNNEITENDFGRQVKSIVGDHRINVALFKLQTQASKNSRKAAHQIKSETQVSSTAKGPKFLTDQTRDNIGNSRDVKNLSDLRRLQVPSLTSPIRQPKAAPKKHLIGKKRQVEAPGSSPQSRKKPKVPRGFSDDQLNDVIAASGLKLDDEDEQLFSGSKEVTHLSEVSRRVVQEEEEKLFLQKIPLQNKVAEIMSKYGLKCMGNDVVQCLSSCVEVRLRAVIAELNRLSKIRFDMEKPMHRNIVTSDIRNQILAANHQAREKVENKQSEADKSPERTKGNKDEYDKTRAAAANVIIRAATGGDDMVSRWKLMKPLLTSSTGKSKESHKAENHVHCKTPVPVRKAGITKKDVIAILEREPQMSKSILIYRLYNEIKSTGISDKRLNTILV